MSLDMTLLNISNNTMVSIESKRAKNKHGKHIVPKNYNISQIKNAAKCELQNGTSDKYMSGGDVTDRFPNSGIPASSGVGNKSFACVNLILNQLELFLIIIKYLKFY